MSKEIKRKLASGEFVITVNPGGDNRDLIDMLARYGADLAFIDCERTGLGLDAAGELLRAARASGLPAVVRSWSHQPEVLVQYLDRRASGVVVPRIETPEQARAVVQTVRYACADASERLVIVQIESRAGADAAEEIAAVEGVDAVLIGPNDMAYDITGDRRKGGERVQAVIDALCKRLRTVGMPFGMPCDMTTMARFKALGATLVYYPAAQLIERGLREVGQGLGR